MMLDGHFVYGNYYYDSYNKRLFVHDKEVAEGEIALQLAFELQPPSGWKRLESPPLLGMKRMEDKYGM